MITVTTMGDNIKFSSTSFEGIVKKMNANMFSPQQDETSYMKHTAKKVYDMTGVKVNTEDCEKFLRDLKKINFIYIQE